MMKDEYNERDIYMYIYIYIYRERERERLMGGRMRTEKKQRGK